METQKMADGKTSQIKRLGEVASEMALSFDRWDRLQADGFDPVAIQDLDFWLSEIKAVIKQMEDN